MFIRSTVLTGAASLFVLAMAVPAVAQSDMSGVWQPRYHEDQPERIPGPELRDYAGLPINDAARQYADSWDPSRLTLPEEQCRVHVSPYIFRGPLNFRMWEEKHPKTQDLLALKIYTSTFEQTRTIWMDGRPHPSPNAAHTWMGFSTGRYDGDMLVVETTHIKKGWVRRNGLPMSDRARMTEYFVVNGDVMTHTVVLVDPLYLTEPLVKSEDFMRSARELPAGTWLWVCDAVIEVPRPLGEVPAYLPGEHPFKDEFMKRHNLPEVAVLGGANTMYPEFQPNLGKFTAPVIAQPGRGGGAGGRGAGPAAPPAGAPAGGRGQGR